MALVDGVLTQVLDGHRHERSIGPADEPRLLAELFGVELPGPADVGPISPSR